MSWKVGEHEYSIRLDFGAMQRVKDATTIDLLHPERSPEDAAMPVIVALADDELAMLAVLYELVRPQADGLKIDKAAFIASCTAEQLALGAAELMGALAGFFEALGRKDRASLVRKTGAILTESIEQVRTGIEAVNVTELVREAIAGGTSGSAPASSA